MRPSHLSHALLLALVLLGGCITRPVREPVYDEGLIEVFLRSEKKFSTVVEKGYDHPVVISSVRLTHILSRLDVRRSTDEGKGRKPGIPTEILYSVAEGVSKALEKASPDQEVVAMAVRKERTFKVFDQDYLTSFVAYVRGGQLYIHLERSDWMVPDRYRNQVGLPEPRAGENPTELKVFGGTAMTRVDRHSVAIAWRDPIFSRSTRTKILPTGEVKRKTILLESPEVDEPAATSPGGQAGLPPGLSPAQLRALANVEEERAAGTITEAEYRLRVQEILDR